MDPEKHQVVDGQGIGLVVILGVEASLPGNTLHDILARIALTGPVLLDRAGGNGFVGDLVGLTPGHQCGQKSPVDVTSGDAGGALFDLLEGHPVNPTCHLRHLVEPALELEEAHPGPLVASGLERLRAALLLPVTVWVDVRAAPARLCAQVKGE